MKSRCQCGTCTVEIRGAAFVSYTCHCIECQKLSGSAFQTCAQFPYEAIEQQDGVLAKQSRVGASGNRLDTYFCHLCSSALYSVNSARPNIATFYVGCLEEPKDILVSAHIWLSQKQPWVLIPDTHRQFQQGGDWHQDYVKEMWRYNPKAESID